MQISIAQRTPIYSRKELGSSTRIHWYTEERRGLKLLQLAGVSVLDLPA
jgi:hypothetical protein